MVYNVLWEAQIKLHQGFGYKFQALIYILPNHRVSLLSRFFPVTNILVIEEVFAFSSDVSHCPGVWGYLAFLCHFRGAFRLWVANKLFCTALRILIWSNGGAEKLPWFLIWWSNATKLQSLVSVHRTRHSILDIDCHLCRPILLLKIRGSWGHRSKFKCLYFVHKYPSSHSHPEHIWLRSTALIEKWMVHVVLITNHILLDN